MKGLLWKKNICLWELCTFYKKHTDADAMSKNKYTHANRLSNNEFSLSDTKLRRTPSCLFLGKKRPSALSKYPSGGEVFSFGFYSRK